MDSGNLPHEPVSFGGLRLWCKGGTDRSGGLQEERRGVAVGGINVCLRQLPWLTADLASLSCSGRDALSSSSSRARAEASENGRINGSQGADARLIKVCCLPPPASSLPLTGGGVRSCPVLSSSPRCLLWWFDASTEWNEGALLVKALVGSCCGPNLGLAFLSLSVSPCPSLALATLLCSRGRRNSHARHQVDTLKHLGGPMLLACAHFLYLSCLNNIFLCLSVSCIRYLTSVSRLRQTEFWNSPHEPFPTSIGIEFMWYKAVIPSLTYPKG